MAAQPRPGRTLGAFFLAVALLFGLVALAGSWVPRLGLDLQGGTRITLIATGEGVTEENLALAAGIVDDRVNGSGVAEAEVAVQGDRFIVVEIPGESRRGLVDVVKRQAQMRFRIVASSGAGTTPAPSPSDPLAPSPSLPTPSGPAASPSPGGDATEAPRPRQRRGRSPAPQGAAPADAAVASPAAYRPTAGEASEPPEPSVPAEPEDPAASPSPASPSPAEDDAASTDPLAWAKSPDPESLAAFGELTCPPAGEPVAVDDDPDRPLVTCDAAGTKYLLSPAMIEGPALESASAAQPQNSLRWVVSLDFDRGGAETFAEISRDLYGTGRQFAIVLDGQVISAPTMEGIITNGRAEISGSFSEAEASDLATSLQFGALPIAFEDDPPVETVGPSLAGDQLAAGLLAGGAGLLLVMVYCLLYYRGLGLVVIASLVVAAALTYALVLLLSETAGYTLSLPGIAGLIVAVGITADSFIVFFERIRDEMRDGKSLRVAVESGWVRARATCVAADSVSLLAAVVLYIFAAGVVKGFAFALGLCTLIDLLVFFVFTKPLVAWLARFGFFHRGHRLSGLSAETLGVDRIRPEPRAAAGRA